MDTLIPTPRLRKEDVPSTRPFNKSAVVAFAHTVNYEQFGSLDELAPFARGQIALYEKQGDWATLTLHEYRGLLFYLIRQHRFGDMGGMADALQAQLITLLERIRAGLPESV